MREEKERERLGLSCINFQLIKIYKKKKIVCTMCTLPPSSCDMNCFENKEEGMKKKGEREDEEG